jgi:hypothetical protein
MRRSRGPRRLAGVVVGQFGRRLWARTCGCRAVADLTEPRSLGFAWWAKYGPLFGPTAAQPSQNQWLGRVKPPACAPGRVMVIALSSRAKKTGWAERAESDCGQTCKPPRPLRECRHCHRLPSRGGDVRLIGLVLGLAAG